MRKLTSAELGRISVADFKQESKFDLVIVLDNIRSMHNVGAAFRTSDAFRINKIILTGITAKPPHRDIHKAALGATDSVDWEYVNEPIEAVNQLKEKGYQIIAAEQAEGSVTLEEFKPEVGQKFALVFGNEVFGVSDNVVNVADGCVEIPQFGTKHSLNVSVSMGIVIWDFYQKLRPF
ncbi:MAG: RNA methyltransferase [Cyclobacteriaceae bacterium]